VLRIILEKNLILKEGEKETKQENFKLNIKKSFFKSKLFIGIFILVIILLIIVFFIFRGDSLCKGIGDEFVKEGCKSCNDVPDPLDCLGDVYLGAAVLNKNVSFCENIEYDYIKEDCFLQVESIFIGGERHSSRDNF